MESVNHPKHYNALEAECSNCNRSIECIDVVREMNFNRGNAVKYIWRAGHKENQIQDLQKAVWYLQDEINRLTKSYPENNEDDGA